MTIDFRALCEELLADYGQCRYRSELHDRALALLSQPEPVVPTDEELVNFRNRATADCCASRSNNGANLLSSDDLVACQAAGLRAVLARWGQPTPQPPADGEVARFAGWLRAHRDQCVELGRPDWAHMVNRAAELLERFASPACVMLSPSPEALASLKAAGPGRIERLPDGAQIIEPAERTLLVPVAQPIPVAERLPGPEDCDAEGQCWMFGNVVGDWRLISMTNPGVPQLKYCFSHWLPANALPVPAND